MANLNSREMAKIAVEKRLCKEYCDASKGEDNFIVYLNNGDEFQIQLFNPTNRVIGAKLEFNNENVGWHSTDSYVVLRPGERVWLERFLDCHDKFIFNTYEVSNSSQVIEAIRDNGDISIRFFYEDTSAKCRGITVSEPFTFAPTPNLTYYCGDVIGNLSSVRCGTNSCLGLHDMSASTYCNTTADADSMPCSHTLHAAKSIETGRVEHGGYSNQNFKNVYYNFETWPFASKHFKLLPVSRKQYSDSDLKKVYCTNCGKKLSPKFKFCPVCGTKVSN